jgi:hypothetical protein
MMVSGNPRSGVPETTGPAPMKNGILCRGNPLWLPLVPPLVGTGTGLMTLPFGTVSAFFC